MGMVRDCLDFDHQWNQRIDDRRQGEDAPERAAALADHAAWCESCRSRGLTYAELDSLPTPWRAIPTPSAAAVERWRSVALAAAPRLATRPRWQCPRHLVGFASKAAIATAAAASVLIGSQAILPILFPLAAAPLPLADRPSRLFEEAFSEATSMTWDLAREVSAPAARISSEVLGWHDKRAQAVVPPEVPPLPELVEAAPAPGPEPREADTPAAGVELISGSARHAFRFLSGTTDEVGDSEIVGGF